MSYSEIKAINWSSLKHIWKSPLQYQWHLKNPEPPKTAYLLGSAIHCKVLEPDKFKARYTVYEGTRNKRHKAYQAFLEEHPGLDILSPDELKKVHHAADAIEAHPVASALIARCRHEESLTWTDPETGYKCKGRVDGISDLILDLKKMRSVAHRKACSTVAEYMYHGQMAWYHDGAIAAKKIDGAIPPHVVGIEDDGPCDVGVFTIEGEALEAGRRLYRDMLRKLRVCIETDTWPGASPDIWPIELPRWAAGVNLIEEGF